jgi:radical SAM superfamily enzyme with C-terminal helix-hairpin-helix motif
MGGMPLQEVSKALDEPQQVASQGALIVMDCPNRARWIYFYCGDGCLCERMDSRGCSFTTAAYEVQHNTSDGSGS